MATYLPGVTDYIPQIQPFVPDFNFYTNALQTKQAQYDAGYEKISGLYGTLLNSEMSRTDNIERRDQFFTNVDNSIKKISGLDLSKDQNIKAAAKVFQPIIDDKFIQRDIAFTKVYRRELERANGFKNCTDEKKCGGKYWDDGVRALNYKVDEFTKVGINDTLGFANPSYTPYVNVYAKAMDFAKEMGFDKAENISWTPDGRYIIKTTSGPQQIPSLTDSFVNYLKGDGAAMSMYNTQAYLARKDYATQYAEQFGGEEGAERDYLNTKVSEINQIQSELLKQAEDQLKLTKNKKAVGEKSLEKTPVEENLDKDFLTAFDSLNGQEEINNSAVEFSKSTLSNTEGIENLDIQSMRARVDSATANQLFYGDMQSAATDFAMNTMKVDIQADQYAVASFEHDLRVQEMLLKDVLERKQKADEKAAAEAEEEMVFDENGMPVDGGAGQAAKIDPVKLVESEINSANGDYATGLEAQSKYVLDKLNAVISDPNRSKQERELASKKREEIFGTASVYEDPNDPEYQKAIKDAAENGEGSWFNEILGSVEFAAGADMGIIGAGILAAGLSNPIGWAALAVGGVAMFNGTQDFLDNSDKTSKVPVPKKTKDGYMTSPGELASFRNNVTGTDYNNPNNFDALKSRIDTFVSTQGDGLFRDDALFLKNTATLKQSIDLAQMKKNAALSNVSNNNKLVRDRMVAKYGSDFEPGMIDLMFTPNGTKKTFEQFAKDYATKYDPSLLEGESSGYGETGTLAALTTAGAIGGGPIGAGFGFLAGLIANGVIDDIDDIYQDLDEKYKKTYTSDEVQGLKSGRGSLDDGITGVFAQNRLYSFDPAGKSPLKDAVRDLYAKDIAPALRNPSARGATFTFSNLSNLEADEELTSNSQAGDIMSQILRSSFQTKWKETNDNRPLFDITRMGMVQGDPNKVGLTFTLSEDFVKKYKGSEKSPGLTWGLKGNDISVVMDRDKVNSQFFKSTETSDLEFILNSVGQLDINSYNQYGGTSSIKKSANGQYVIDHSLKYVDPESGQLMSVNQQYVEPDVDINYLYAQLSTDLQTNYESVIRQLRKKNGE
jgi:hypothetical protein